MAVRMLSKSYSGLERGPAVTSAAQQGGPARSKSYSGLERVRPVILSTAKDLARRMERSFAALRACPERSEGMKGMISKCLVINSTICYYLHKRATMKPFHSME